MDRAKLDDLNLVGNPFGLPSHLHIAWLYLVLSTIMIRASILHDLEILNHVCAIIPMKRRTRDLASGKTL